MIGRDPYVNATILTGNGGRTWHVMADTRTRCGQRPQRWATCQRWTPADRDGRTAPAESRVCRRCRLDDQAAR